MTWRKDFWFSFIVMLMTAMLILFGFVLGMNWSENNFCQDDVTARRWMEVCSP